MNIFTGFSTCAALISHLRIVHGQQKEYICFFCSSHFTRKHSLNYHIYVHYDVTKFRCRHLDESGKICGRSERHPNHHKEHVAKKHHFCEECNIQFKDINEIDDHWRDEHARTGLVKRSNVKLEVKETNKKRSGGRKRNSKITVENSEENHDNIDAVFLAVDMINVYERKVPFEESNVRFFNSFLLFIIYI